MMKLPEKAVSPLKIAMPVLLAVYCAAESGTVRAAVSSAAERCLYTVIPSLYAMMIAAGIIVGSGAAAYIYGLSSTAGDIAVFAASQFAGYPVGTRILCGEASAGHISRSRAELLSGACCGAGPAFVFGCVPSCGSKRAGLLILVSSVCANIAVALTTAMICGKDAHQRSKHDQPRLSQEVLTGAVASGGRAMADICFMICAFSVFSAMLSDLGIVRAIAVPISEISGLPEATARQLVCTFLDVTAASELSGAGFAILPYLAALVNFGGVCVIMQIAALTRGSIRMRPFIISRLCAGTLSYMICCALEPIFLHGEAVYASAMRVSVCRSATPLPSLLLAAMTVILISDSTGLCKKPEMHRQKSH